MLHKGEINLLPSQALKLRGWRLIRKRANRIFGITVIGLAIIGLTYGTVGWVLWKTRGDLQAEIALLAVNNEGAQRRVRAENTVLRAVVERVEKHPAWTPLVAEALRAAPLDVDVTAVRLAPAVGEDVPMKLVIVGVSTSRTATVEYERRLRELPWLASIEAPLRNLASSTKVQFSFTLSRVEAGTVLPDVPEAEEEGEI